MWLFVYSIKVRIISFFGYQYKRNNLPINRLHDIFDNFASLI
ncbi:hypothetical protein HJ01_00647 [Flavobacterium frigoris PS1]|uniref:Uncharacterized protein n=1 Tax=Flavobacterium frigoris (strain PS1) TaxID=1086011 RepID=H7FNH6_FLAFP|nr:hypothetical protein HJ01_00647 [Flavobacterium frigoris PS1]